MKIKVFSMKLLLYIFSQHFLLIMYWYRYEKNWFSSLAGLLTLCCAFHKHANSKVQRPPSQLHFSLPSIIITITRNEPWNIETHKTDRNPPITNHIPWPFEPVKVKYCFLRGLLRWLTAAKNTIVSGLLNFRIRMFVKSAVKRVNSKEKCLALFSFLFPFQQYVYSGITVLTTWENPPPSSLR